MIEPKPLSECDWESSIISVGESGFWRLSTKDFTGAVGYGDNFMIFQTSHVGPFTFSLEEARADCEVFLKRNGWTRFKWVN